MTGLVDGNNFFVSCERIFNPALEGRPVAVLSNKDGCVVARSPEFKALDIPMGTPVFKLRRDVKRLGLVLKTGNKELYSDISARIMQTLRLRCALVEQYSIDEAFISPKASDCRDLQKFGLDLRAALLKTVGIPCGVGFAPTKTLAKIANHIAKKTESGVFVLPPDPREILAATPVGEVWGIGSRLAPRMKALGILSALDLAYYGDDRLRRHFSVSAARKAMELRGEEWGGSDVDAGEELSQSLSYSRVFGAPVKSLEAVLESVSHYASRAAEKLRAEGQRAGGAEVYLVYYPEYSPQKLEGGAVSARVKFSAATDDTLKIIKALKAKAAEIFVEGRRYKKSGVSLCDLQSGAVQLDMFAQKEFEPKSRLFEAVDAVNRKFGGGTVVLGAEGLRQAWKMPRENQSPSYTTSWGSLPEVK